MYQILYDWTIWARDEQLEPEGYWDLWNIITGRGWGKTRTGAETVRSYVERGLVERIALVAPTAADARDVMVEGESGLLSISPPWFKPEYTSTRRRLVWPNGAQAFTYSSEDPDQLRGPQHGIAWCDEPAAWKYPDDTWSNLMFGLRMKPGKAITTTTPRPIRLIKSLIMDPKAHLTTGTTYENLANLSENFRRMISSYEGTRLGRQELLGQLLLDVEGALWTMDLIDNNRIGRDRVPTMERIVVAIDPAVSSKATSDETGIVIVGRGICYCKGDAQIHGFVFDDLSMKATPDVWARAAVGAYKEWKADRIVGEVNNGGDLVEHTIRTIDQYVPYKGVHATRGKVRRAEPIVALYEQGRVHHVGMFSEMEDQMTTWVPDSDTSPDRMDGLVWGLTELFVEPREKTRRVVLYSPIRAGINV